MTARRVRQAAARRAALAEDDEAIAAGQSDQDALDHIAEVSRNARATWFGLLGVLLFCAVTLMGHQDRDFFEFGAATSLPLVGVDVPPYLFFLGAPLLVLGLYVYFHVYLAKLWRALAPSAAPEQVRGRHGRVDDLDEMAFPWLLTDAALRWRSKKFHRPFGWMTALVSWLLGWALAPALLALFWIRSMPLHDERLTSYLGLLLLICFCAGWASRGYMRDVMSGGKKKRLWRRTLHWAFASVLGAMIGFAGWQTTEAGLLSGDGVTQIPDHCVPNGFLDGLHCLWADLQRNGDIALLWPADLDQAEIGRPSAGYLPLRLFHADFRAVFIERAKARFGAGWEDADNYPDDMDYRADDGWRAAFQLEFQERRQAQRNLIAYYSLAGADLRRASLRGAQLDGVNLYGARLEGADLRAAHLEGANLTETILEDADLSEARLEYAILTRAMMSKVTLRRAELVGARLDGAELRNADLTGARLDRATIATADMMDAGLDFATMRFADLRRVCLRNTSLRSAELHGALFRRANLTDAVLDNAVIDGADFRSAIYERDAKRSAEDLKEILGEQWKTLLLREQRDPRCAAKAE